MRVLSLLAASFLTLAIAAPGVAQTPETPSVIVSYGDLDLTSPEGSATLDRRIEAAAEKVCQKPRIVDLKAMTSWEECKAASLEDAREQLSFTNNFESLALTSLF
jgi:UrcA family protein